MSGMSGVFLFTYAKRRHLGSVKFAYLQWSRCTYFDVTSASPIFGFTSLASPLTYIAWASPVFGFRTRCFLLTERGSHGHHQREICHRVTKSSLGWCCSVLPKPPFQGVRVLQAQDIHQSSPRHIMLSRSPLQDLLVTRSTDSSLKWALFRSFTRDLLGDLPMRK